MIITGDLEIYPNKQDKIGCLPFFQSEDEIFREIVEATKNIIFKLNEEEKMTNLEPKLEEVITTLKGLKRKKRRVVIVRKRKSDHGVDLKTKVRTNNS